MSSVRKRLTFIEPQLPTLIDRPPQGVGWIHEVKHDGYRNQLVIERGTVRAFTRTGLDWSERYPGIVGRAGSLPCRSAILDGEVNVQDGTRAVFHVLSRHLDQGQTRKVHDALPEEIRRGLWPDHFFEEVPSRQQATRERAAGPR